MEKGPFETIGEGIANSRHRFQMLDPVSQNLRRAGNGFALVVTLLIGPFVMFGLRGVGHYLAMFFGDPGHTWFYAAAYVGLFAFGLIRFLVGASRVAGARDALHLGRNALYFAIFFGIGLYLWSGWPWTQVATVEWGYAIMVLLSGFATWHALSFGMQLALPFWPRHSARKMVAGHIEEEEFSWDDAPTPRRWQFRNKSRR